MGLTDKHMAWGDDYPDDIYTAIKSFENNYKDQLRIEREERDKLVKQNQELRAVCFRLSEGIYEFLGDGCSKDDLRRIVDSTINDDKYKPYLSQKYILKTVISDDIVLNSDKDPYLESRCNEEELNGVEEMKIKGID